ncbi:MAG: hypothetical protein GX639_21285 [Fibrobacter sp.]|nr:hypothetical protein [Fibrobacter sp.]
MKRKNKTLFNMLIIIVVVVTILLVINPFKKDVWDINADNFRDSFNIISGTTTIDDLSQWGGFEWDVMYSFRPYVSKEKVYEVVGYKWDNINETVNENMNQIVFIKDGKVVCYIYGYPNNTGLEFNFGEYEGDYIKLSSKNRISFNSTFDDNNNFRYFEYINK